MRIVVIIVLLLVMVPTCGAYEYIATITDLSCQSIIYGNGNQPLKSYMRILDSFEISIPDGCYVEFLMHNVERIEKWTGEDVVVVREGGGESKIRKPIISFPPVGKIRLKHSPMLTGQPTIINAGGQVRSTCDKDEQLRASSSLVARRPVDVILRAVSLEADGQIDAADRVLSEQFRTTGNSNIYDLIQSLRDGDTGCD